MSTWERRAGTQLTPILMNLASIVERMDEGILPAVYFFIGRSLDATLPQLGALTLCRAIVQALSSPISGILGDRCDRTRVVTAGCLIWGVMTVAVGVSTSLRQAMVACAFNGMGLALVIPSVQSVVADCHPAEQRGRAFGLMSLTSSLGGMVGAFFATNAGSSTFYGVEGWRFAFFLVAAISLGTGFLVLHLARDPRHASGPGFGEDPVPLPRQLAVLQRTGSGGIGEPRPPRPPHDVVRYGPESLQARKAAMPEEGPDLPGYAPLRIPEGWAAVAVNGSSGFRSVMSEVRLVLGIRSFQVMILQGVVGSIPWQAMVMFTVWFQLLGFSDLQASSCMAIFGLGCAVGSLIGGHIGDVMAARYPGSGRVFANQVSVVLGLPLSVLLIKGLPQPVAGDPHFGAYAGVLLLMGLLVSWCGCNNSALFADLVPEQLRSTIYAFDRSFEGAIGAFGAPLVGLTAERCFGFSGTVGAGRDDAESARNARALGDALLVMLALPWLVCLLAFTGMHWTYPRDCAAVHRAARRAASEMDLAALVPLEHASRRRRVRS
ncbi:hypothetical protein ACKKBG_A28005 [Auxenochlorella protothecoides x Auxenochlorella symbiontica]